MSIMGIEYWRCGWRRVGWSIVLCLERDKYQHQFYYLSFNHNCLTSPLSPRNNQPELQDLQSPEEKTEPGWESAPAPGCRGRWGGAGPGTVRYQKPSLLSCLFLTSCGGRFSFLFLGGRFSLAGGAIITT